ncbi:FAD-dependent oxidoreductase [Pontibacillus yanchengensis]|nr:FAD-dependent oxidoreductase [Pontibacillus yanchengensis]
MKQLILVGAGHAHLHIIKQWIDHAIDEVELTILSPNEYQYYSGMFSGYTEGLYDIEDIRVNVESLAEQAGATFYKEAVMSVDGEQKILLTDKGKVLSYDAVSFDIGSLTAHTDLPGIKEYAKRIKPNYHFPDMIKEMQESSNPVIVGGGIAGTELALSLQAYRQKHQEIAHVTLISSSNRLLENQSQKASNKMEQIVQEREISTHTGKRVREIDSTHIITETNEKIDYKDVLWLAGPKAPDLFRVSNLPIDEEGYLQVESTLQVKAHPSIFGAGDCITLTNAPNLPKNGVFAIKQAPILWDNLKGFLTDSDGQHYKPQKKYLAIMSIGHKEGFLLYGSWTFKGKLAWKLKHSIDQKFIQSYQQN